MGSAPAKVVQFEEALAIVRKQAMGMSRRTPEAEMVALLDSAGRVLARGVMADRDHPAFDRSTRDGFAVRAAELDEGAVLRVAGQVRAGESWGAGELEAGTAVEIMTGAPVPRGADAVVMVEHVTREADRIRLVAGRGLRTGDNVVPRASEAGAGDEVLPAGRRIGAAEIALAANCGCPELAVLPLPAVAIVATGDELVELNQTPGPEQIWNSNSYAIASMVTAAGGKARRLEIARDLRQDVWERVAQGRARHLLVFSGGVSMGEYDLVEEVLEEFGAEFFFTGVAMQPGRPVVFGRLPAMTGAGGAGPECYFFGLPGNPISTQVTFHCFVEPFLRALSGELDTGPRWAQATLAEAVGAKAGLTRLLPARMEGVEIRIVGWQGSGDLAANARANCYAELLPGLDYRPGQVIRVLLR